MNPDNEVKTVEPKTLGKGKAKTAVDNLDAQSQVAQLIENPDASKGLPDDVKTLTAEPKRQPTKQTDEPANTEETESLANIEKELSAARPSVRRRLLVSKLRQYPDYQSEEHRQLLKLADKYKINFDS